MGIQEDLVEKQKFSTSLLQARGVSASKNTDKILYTNIIGWDPWKDWEVSYSATGSMTFTSVTTNNARYVKQGRTVTLQIHATGTTGGTASSGIYFTAPIKPRLWNNTANVIGSGASCGDVITSGGVIAWIQSVQRFRITKYDSSNWNLGTNKQIRVEITYEI